MTYTSHGHHIPGTSKDDEFGHIPRARCGGVAICTVCQRDASLVVSGDVIPPQFFEDTSTYQEDPDQFLKKAKLFVVSAQNSRVLEEAFLTIDDLYIVWFSKTLNNWKALISTSMPGDGLYFEVTHNGDREETYVDTYLKIANDVFSQEGL